MPRDTTLHTAGAGDAREYAFSHHILQQVVYETVLKSRRRDTHAAAARWFAMETGARANDFLGMAAAHFELAGDARNACEYFARAAENAALAFAHEAVLDYTKRALEHVQPHDLAMQWRLVSHREATLDLQGRRGEQLAAVLTLIDLAERLDDDQARGDAAYRRCTLALRTGDYPTAEHEARRALALAESAGADELAMQAQVRLAGALANQGRLAEASRLAQQGLERSRAMGLPRLEAYFRNGLGICWDLSGDTAAALASFLEVLALTRKIGDRRMEAVTLGNVGLWYLKVGAYEESRRFLEEGLRVNRLLGIRETQGHVLCSLSELTLCEGDAAAALRYAQEALAISVEVNARQNETSALSVLGNAQLASGFWVAAAASFDRMEKVARDIDFAAAIVEALEGQVRLALARESVDEAVGALERLLASAQEIAAASGNSVDPFAGGIEHQIRLTIYRAWALAGDPRADESLREAHRLLQIRADAISDNALRNSYLARVQAHREIQVLWRASQP